jgi:tRNA(Arg) A34 adenosine deaminase TadA
MLVRNGQLLAEGANAPVYTHDSSFHAETAALQAATALALPDFVNSDIRPKEVRSMRGRLRIGARWYSLALRP